MMKTRKRLALNATTIRVMDLRSAVGGAARDTDEGASCFACTMTCQPTLPPTSYQSYECMR